MYLFKAGGRGFILVLLTTATIKQLYCNYYWNYIPRFGDNLLYFDPHSNVLLYYASVTARLLFVREVYIIMRLCQYLDYLITSWLLISVFDVTPKEIGEEQKFTADTAYGDSSTFTFECKYLKSFNFSLY